MGKARNIHNLDTLEKEIYRLELEAIQAAGKMGKNLDHFQHNLGSMAYNSFFRKPAPEKEAGKEKGFASFWENDRVQRGIDKIVDHLAAKTAEGIESFIDKILHRKS